MRICLQRVTTASVVVEQELVSQIHDGLLLLVGISHSDRSEDARYLADKCANLRVFEDDQGKMNVSAIDRTAEILAVSQFTLYADTQQGRRPSFMAAAPVEISSPLFDQFVTFLRETGLRVVTGIFGAHMQVRLVNDGPVTILLESRRGD